MPRENFVGLLTQSDLLRAFEQDPSGSISCALDAGSRSPIVAYPDERVFDAVTKMLDNNIGPIAGRRSKRSAASGGLHESRQRDGMWRGHLHEESIREHGWLANLSAGKSQREKYGVMTGRVTAINGGEIRLALDAQATDGGSGGISEELVLNTPTRGVFVGDQVRVDYRSDEKGHKIALRVVEDVRPAVRLRRKAATGLILAEVLDIFVEERLKGMFLYHTNDFLGQLIGNFAA